MEDGSRGEVNLGTNFSYCALSKCEQLFTMAKMAKMVLRDQKFSLDHYSPCIHSLYLGILNILLL